MKYLYQVVDRVPSLIKDEDILDKVEIEQRAYLSIPSLALQQEEDSLTAKQIEAEDIVNYHIRLVCETCYAIVLEVLL